MHAKPNPAAWLLVVATMLVECISELPRAIAKDGEFSLQPVAHVCGCCGNVGALPQLQNGRLSVDADCRQSAKRRRGTSLSARIEQCRCAIRGEAVGRRQQGAYQDPTELACAIRSGAFSWKHWWRSSCDMPQHPMYRLPEDGYYYFQPYNYTAIAPAQRWVQTFGGDARNPYSTEFFDDIVPSEEIPAPTSDPE